MKYTFDDVKNVIAFGKQQTSTGYTIPMLPRLNNLIGNIQQDQTTIVSGLPGAGVSSFIDQNYVMTVLLQWYEITPEERPPLKIFYYSMKSSELKKLQQLLCNYIKLVHALHVDVPTLNNQVGRLFDLSTMDKHLEAIEEATMFFDDVINEGVLTIIDGQKKPTDIYNDVTDFMAQKGRLSSSGVFEFDDEFFNQITLVVVDSTDYLLPDNEGYGIVSGGELDEKFKRQLMELKTNYKISPIIAVPSSVGYIRSIKDTEPHYRHLGPYGSVADRGICIYNPVAEKNVRFYDSDPSKYISSKGNNLYRTWHIVRNVDGIDSASDRILFFPGTSFMIEHSDKKAVINVQEVIDIISEHTCFHVT